jgi:hypothetical protein
MRGAERFKSGGTIKTWIAAPLCLLLAAADTPPAARFTADGALLPPPDYREWVFLSAGLDMSYSERAGAAGMSMFDNVFVDPAAWRAFKATGHWPEGTVFILENRGASGQGSINKHGSFQSGAPMGLEAHVKDAGRFKGGWGFFDVGNGAPGKLIPYEARCYSCHQAHGAVETTFTQFYPTAKPIALKAGTYLDR